MLWLCSSMFGPLQKTWIHDQVCLDCTSLNDTATPFECWGKCMCLLTALRYFAYASISMFESIVCCDSRRFALPHSIRTAQLLHMIYYLKQSPSSFFFSSLVNHASKHMAENKMHWHQANRWQRITMHDICSRSRSRSRRRNPCSAAGRGHDW